MKFPSKNKLLSKLVAGTVRPKSGRKKGGK